MGTGAGASDSRFVYLVVALDIVQPGPEVSHLLTKLFNLAIFELKKVPKTLHLKDL